MFIKLCRFAAYIIWITFVVHYFRFQDGCSSGRRRRAVNTSDVDDAYDTIIHDVLHIADLFSNGNIPGLIWNYCDCPRCQRLKRSAVHLVNALAALDSPDVSPPHPRVTTRLSAPPPGPCSLIEDV